MIKHALAFLLGSACYVAFGQEPQYQQYPPQQLQPLLNIQELQIPVQVRAPIQVQGPMFNSFLPQRPTGPIRRILHGAPQLQRPMYVIPQQMPQMVMPQQMQQMQGPPNADASKLLQIIMLQRLSQIQQQTERKGLLQRLFCREEERDDNQLLYLILLSRRNQ